MHITVEAESPIAATGAALIVKKALEAHGLNNVELGLSLDAEPDPFYEGFLLGRDPRVNIRHDCYQVAVCDPRDR